MGEQWPALPLDAWKATCDTVHMYSQIVGKIRLALAPFEPQWAEVPLYVTTRGLSTSPMPLPDRSLQIEFDFIEHALVITTSDGLRETIALEPRSVRDFYDLVMRTLKKMGIQVKIWTMPVEIPEPIRFTDDTTNKSYDRDYVERFHRVLTEADLALKAHRAPFRGRHMPVAFFWGTFDLAYTRFSGRPASPGTDDYIRRLAMDAEEICAGFWPGDERFPEPAFWCYAFPKPNGLESAKLDGPGYWDPHLGEFMMRYQDIRALKNPRDAVASFFKQTYDRAATLANWPSYA